METETFKFVIQVRIGTMKIGENLRTNGYPMTTTRRRRGKFKQKKRGFYQIEERVQEKKLDF